MNEKRLQSSFAHNNYQLWFSILPLSGDSQNKFLRIEEENPRLVVRRNFQYVFLGNIVTAWRNVSFPKHFLILEITPNIKRGNNAEKNIN